MIELVDNRIVIDCQTLIGDFGISKNTVYCGVNEYQKQLTYNWENYKEGKEVFVFLDTIPTTTRNKLPEIARLKAFIKEETTDSIVQAFYQKLQYAKLNQFLKHRIYYRDRYGLNPDKTLIAMQKRATWDRFMQLYNENKTGANGGLKKGTLEALLNAYNKVYPGGYSSIQSLKRAINTLEARGVDAVCVDGRALKNADKPASKYDERHLFLLTGVVSSGKAYKAPKIREKLAEMCNDEGIDCPSLSWIKEQKATILKNIEIYNNRSGADKTDKVTPYTGIKPAFYADDQYQIDGWDLPFYYLDENKKLKKLTLIAVWDAYSRKIVGYCVSRSENRLSLFEALQDAVANSSALPFELISDNHSYNQTEELGNFKELFNNYGATWRVTSNPQDKAIGERGFGTLGDKFCKDYYGYIGQGVKTRDKDGRTKQELIDKYLKSGKILTEDQIKLIGIDVVSKYNKTKLPSRKKSPNELYAESSKPNRIEIDLYERLKLFTKKTEYKVSRNQINIEIAGIKYEYQLPAELYRKYDRTVVSVRYDTPELIYLFDKVTDKPIIALGQKEKAAGALANQTPYDIDILNRSTGRLKGIKAQARKENEDLAKEASKLSPTIFETLNNRLTPKNVAKLLESEEVTNEALKRGINLSRIEEIPVFSEVENPAFSERKRTRKERSPFAPENHQISKIDFDSE